MWRGLYTAGAGMIQETQRTDTIANNLANVNTTGYKRDVAVSSEFEPMLIRRINDKDMRSDVTSFKGFSLGGNPPVVGTLGLGSEIAEIATDHSQGMFESTGNPYDVAISGEGYFEIQTPQGVRYTRDGAFFRSRTGVLENVRGQAVLGTNVVSEMVELINNYRIYEAGSKSVTTQDAMLDKSVNEVGKL